MTYLRVISIGRTEFRSLEAEFPEPFSQMKAVAVWKKARRILKMAMDRKKKELRDEEARSLQLSPELTLSEDGGGEDAATSSDGAVLLGDAIRRSSSVERRGDGEGGKPPLSLRRWSAAAEAEAAADSSAAPGGGGGNSEEVLQAIDVLGGLLLEMNRRVNEQQAAQAEAFEELTNANDATRKRLNALSEQVIALSDQMGQQPQMRVAKAAPEAASPRPKDGPPAERRSMLVSPASSGGSPRDDALRQQSARARSAFREMIAERDSMGGGQM